jgi:hypothetical protein
MMRTGFRRLRCAGLLATSIAALTIFPGSAGAATSGNSRVIALGAYVDSQYQPRRIDRYARMVGRKPVIVGYYKQWKFRLFKRAELAAVWNRGAVPMVTWEPWHLDGRGISLRAIARGRYDRRVRRAARTAVRWGRPILLRFAHEMNGNWYPWGRGRKGNTARVYKVAWRHLVAIFRRFGANNVSWVWTPNVNPRGKYPFRGLYPGDRWVDWVGFDGFNWAFRGEWDSFTALFGRSYNTLARMTSRPMIVAETGSSESGGDKAAWVSSALRREIPRFSRIRAVAWFSRPANGVDLRVNSSRAALRAFRTAIASPRYGETRNGFLSTPRNLRRRTVAPAAPSGDFGEPSFFYRITHKLHGRYLVFAIGIAVGLVLLLALLIVTVRRTLRTRAAR